MRELTYRTASIKDLPKLYEFEQGIVTAERPFNPTLQEGHINYYDLKEIVESDDSEVVVAVVEGELVGSGFVQRTKAKPYLKFEYYALIGFMYVHPDFRGRGISQGIIDELISWAKSRGLHEIRLTVYEDNARAVRAYEKVGFHKYFAEMRMEVE